MKIKSIAILLGIALTSFIWTGCVKEGPIGPEGPAGLDAEVTTSPWYTPTAWTWDNNNSEWFFDVSNAAITSDIVEHGVILAYVSLPNDVYPNAVRAMPAYALGCNWDYLIPDYGQIEFSTDAVAKPGTTGYQFRFVLIPSNFILKSTKLKSTRISDLKTMPYEDVCNLLGIQK
jgi:hypothetical protein